MQAHNPQVKSGLIASLSQEAGVKREEVPKAMHFFHSLPKEVPKAMHFFHSLPMEKKSSVP